MCTLCILSHASCGRKHRSSLSLHLFPANPRLVQFNLSVKHDLLPQAQSQEKLKKIIFLSMNFGDIHIYYRYVIMRIDYECLRVGVAHCGGFHKSLVDWS